jgi:hypothetical protein
MWGNQWYGALIKGEIGSDNEMAGEECEIHPSTILQMNLQFNAENSSV